MISDVRCKFVKNKKFNPFPTQYELSIDADSQIVPCQNDAGRCLLVNAIGILGMTTPI